MTVASVAFCALLVAVMYVSARGAACNAARLRDAWRTAPLDGLDLSAATVAPVPTPRRWPPAMAISDPAMAASYVSLADDRAISAALLSELLTVVSAAALGVWLPDALRGVVEMGRAVVVLGGALVGVTLRLRVARYWEPVGAQYLARYSALTALPAPAPQSWRERVLGRMRGHVGRTSQEPRSGRPM